MYIIFFLLLQKKRKKGYQTFLTPADTKISVILSASVERFGVSCMRDFSEPEPEPTRNYTWYLRTLAKLQFPN